MQFGILTFVTGERISPETLSEATGGQGSGPLFIAGHTRVPLSRKIVLERETRSYLDRLSRACERKTVTVFRILGGNNVFE